MPALALNNEAVGLFAGRGRAGRTVCFPKDATPAGTMMPPP